MIVMSGDSRPSVADYHQGGGSRPALVFRGRKILIVPTQAKSGLEWATLSFAKSAKR
jgi:hypothetical protein